MINNFGTLNQCLDISIYVLRHVEKKVEFLCLKVNFLKI